MEKQHNPQGMHAKKSKAESLSDFREKKERVIPLVTPLWEQRAKGYDMRWRAELHPVCSVFNDLNYPVTWQDAESHPTIVSRPF